LAQFGAAVNRTMLPPGQSLFDVLRTAADPALAVAALLNPNEPAPKPAATAAAPSPVTPVLSPIEVSVEKHSAEETVLAVSDRTYRVRGLARNTGYESLKVSLRVACGTAWHLDTIDLAQAKSETRRPTNSRRDD